MSLKGALPATELPRRDFMLNPITSLLGTLNSLVRQPTAYRLLLYKPPQCHAVANDLIKVTSTSHSVAWPMCWLPTVHSRRSGPWTCTLGHCLLSSLASALHAWGNLHALAIVCSFPDRLSGLSPLC